MDRGGYSIAKSDYYDENAGFYGIFNEYDWTEFLFYVGGAIIIFLLVHFSKNTEETTK